MPGGFGALILRPDALPDTNPPLFRARDRLNGVLDCTPPRQRNIYYVLTRLIICPIFKVRYESKGLTDRFWSSHYFVAFNVHRWNRLRTLCDTNKKLGVILEISADLPSDDVLDRWFGEPVRGAVVPTSIFLTNKKGFPVLSRPHQNLIRRLFKVITCNKF